MSIKPFELIEAEDAVSYDPMYNVILFNDNHNLYENVIAAIQEAIKCSHEVAEYITHTAHTTGKAKVTTGPKYFVESVYSVLISWKLTCSIEKV